MNIRYSCMPVTNLWLAPDKVREMDRPWLEGAEGFEDWLNAMDPDRRRDLVGRLESQLLYGEPALVLEEREGWARVCLPRQATRKNTRGYPGWVPSRHLCAAPRFQRAQNAGPFAWVTADRTRLVLEGEGDGLVLSFMTRLPFLREEDGSAVVLTPDGGSGRLPLSHVTVAHQLPLTDPADRVETARRFLGLPYLWAGMSSFGFDCSGFVHRVFEAHGVCIPRDADDQARMGRRLMSEGELAPGDLVFFAHEQGRGAIHHVGMVIGGGRFIHSPNTGNPVRINALRDEPYGAELCGGARYDGTETLAQLTGKPPTAAEKNPVAARRFLPPGDH